MNRFDDPNDKLNSIKYHTGKACIEDGCNAPAGTAWSSYWCQKHNAERIYRIDRSLNAIMAKLFSAANEL